MPRLPDVFGQPTKPSSSSTSLHHARDPLGVGEGRARAAGRCRCGARPGCSTSRPPRRPRVEVQRAEVRRPDHVGELGDAELVGVPPGGEGDPGGLDPLGTLLGDALLVDRLALGPVRVALELGRPLVEGAHDPVPDREVVVDEVELRLAARREVHLVRVGDLDEALTDLQLDERRRHGNRSIVCSQ